MQQTEPARPVFVVQHEDEAGLGRLTGRLGPVRLFRPDLGRPLPDPEELPDCAGLVVLGGVYGVWDDDVWPWLPATRALLARAVAAGVPTLGICLGAQLLAAAAGGLVDQGEAGYEVGVTEVALAPAAASDRLFGQVRLRHGDRLEVVQCHRDAVLELPPGSTLLAVGGQYPYQAFRVGDWAWGVQYHPEVLPEDFTVWTADPSPEMLRSAPDLDAVTVRMHDAEERLAALAESHAAAFRAVLRARGSLLPLPVDNAGYPDGLPESGLRAAAAGGADTTS